MEKTPEKRPKIDKEIEKLKKSHDFLTFVEKFGQLHYLWNSPITMDILRKEINAIYEAQHLDKETLDPKDLENAKERAEILADVSKGCTVITDASCDRCHIYSNGLAILIGLSDNERFHREANSSDEDEIYNRIHPEDLAEKRMLEYEFFKSVHSMDRAAKTCCKATCRLRMTDSDGAYRIIDNSTQIARLSPSGTIWLILCCYILSPDQRRGEDIEPRIVDLRNGEITELAFGDRKRTILTGREKEILRLIQEGKASKRIADILGISVHTVNRHRQNIIEKLSVGNCIEAIAAAAAMRLL